MVTNFDTQFNFPNKPERLTNGTHFILFLKTLLKKLFNRLKEGGPQFDSISFMSVTIELLTG